jgi:hypothetical protein
MARRKPQTPEQTLERWMRGRRLLTTNEARDVRNRFEAGSDGYISVGGSRYERYWFEDGSYAVVEWDDDGSIGIV